MTAEQLRNSILQEAISGRLVPQDPNDEPASVLLQRIREEKARLVKEGTIKAKEVLEYTIDDIPYELPDNWSWVKLGEISYPIKRGKSPVYVENSQYIAFAQKCNTKKGYIDLGLAKYIESKKAETQADIYLKLGDIVINSTGTGTLGRVGLFNVEYPENIIGVVPDSHVATVRLLSIYPEYAYYFLRTCQAYLESLGEGGTNQKELKPSSIAELLFPLPPLAEQKRIVAKLEELLPIVEQYGKAQKELDELNAALPARLRQSILQEAISGRLVPQDPNDEPASMLLDGVQKQREQLIKDKKVKAKDIASEPIGDDEKPFELPAKWEFVRLNYVAIIARGGSPRPIKEYLTDSPDGLNWIKIGDTEKGGKYINQTRERIKPEGLKKSRMIHKGDFLLTNSMSFGRPYISNIDGCIHDGWLVISPAFGEVFDKNYLYYVLSSPYARDQFLGKVSGAVVQNLNSDKVATSIIPLPPLAEQQRIVAKIDELFAEIDKLTK